MYAWVCAYVHVNILSDVVGREKYNNLPPNTYEENRFTYSSLHE